MKFIRLTLLIVVAALFINETPCRADDNSDTGENTSTVEGPYAVTGADPENGLFTFLTYGSLHIVVYFKFPCTLIFIVRLSLLCI